MKKLFIFFTMASLALFTACDDEVDVEGLLKYPPTIVSVTPKSTVKAGDFDIKVVFAEGPKTPLSSATLVLKDALSNEVISVTEVLTGTSDSVVVKGADFDAASLGLGDYTLTIIASDVDNNEVRSEVKFKISDQLFAANHSAMYIAGVFNGWGADEMVLVADNTWEIKEVDLQGGGWKFKNTPDWSDVDWGDSNCDKVMEIATGGGPDTKCGYEGLVNIRFNDDDLKYTITPAVTFASNVPSLYLLGSFNNFQGPPDYKFALKADHTWELAEIRLKAGDIFKFAETKTFQGKNFGDGEYDGQAEEFGANIVLPNGTTDAYYKITFNDATLAYELTLVRMPYPADLFFVGGSTSAGWNENTAVKMVKTADGKFEAYAYIEVAGSGFKFLEQLGTYTGDWGSAPGTRAVNGGTVSGDLTQSGEDNATIETDGFYRILVDFTTGDYKIVPMSWAIIGSARTGSEDTGWNDPDTDMNFVGGKGSYTWTITTHLYPGKLKFRGNNTWDINLGDTSADETLEYGGSDIVISVEDDYVIELILDPVGGYTYTITAQ